jgi:hypothetical protein
MDEQVTSKAEENKPNTALLSVIAGILVVAALGVLLAQDGTPENGQTKKAPDVTNQMAAVPAEAAPGVSAAGAEAAVSGPVDDFNGPVEIDWSRPPGEDGYVDIRMRTNYLFDHSLPFSISQDVSSGQGWCAGDDTWTFYKQGSQHKAKWQKSGTSKSITYDAAFGAHDLVLTGGIDQNGKRVRHSPTLWLSIDDVTKPQMEEFAGFELGTGPDDAKPYKQCNNSN